MNALQKIDQPESAVARQEPTVGEMLRGVLEKGITPENAAAAGELMKLYERMQDRDAAKEFARAFADMQADIPKIQATKIIPNKGNVGMRSSFAPFEEIDDQVRPICQKHGFSYSFNEGPFQQGKITKVFRLTHAGGHFQENSFSVRIGQGPPGCSEAQADGAAHSYAKRGALCDGLSIIVRGIDKDADPRADGGSITMEQAKELENRVQQTGSDEKAFLKYAGAANYGAISASKYGMLDAVLKRKESTR